LVQVIAGPQDLGDARRQHIQHQVQFSLFPLFPLLLLFFLAVFFLNLFLHRCQYYAST
jgi:hypothetical protein